jgi:hypothetical protein
MGKGLDYDALFPGRFLKAGLFVGKDVTLTIARVRLEDLPEEKGGNRARGIIGFQETKLELVLNRTNGECIKAMFGRDTGEWVGRRVTFFPAKIDSEFADIAIRVRGSPDIPAAVTFDLKLPRKRPKSVTLAVTSKGKPGARPGNGAPAETEPPPPAPGEPETDQAKIDF